MVNYALCLSLVVLAPFANPALASPPSVGEPTRIWNQERLKICWALPTHKFSETFSSWTSFNTRIRPVSETRRSLVKNLLLTHYPPSLTGITLEGFEDCPPSVDDYDVVFVNDILISRGSVGGVASLGNPSVSREYWDPTSEKRVTKVYEKAALGINDDGMTAYVRRETLGFLEQIANLVDHPTTRHEIETGSHARAFMNASVASAFQANVLHEMGHLFGLRHEETRKDMIDIRNHYPFCQNIAGDAGEREFATPDGETSTFGTSYDVFSIMSYCSRDMALQFHQARFLCNYQTTLKRNSSALSDRTTETLNAFLNSCYFVRANSLPVGLTDTDRVGIRALYNRQHPNEAFAAAELNFTQSEEKMLWVDTFKKLHAFSRELVVEAALRARMISE